MKESIHQPSLAQKLSDLCRGAWQAVGVRNQKGKRTLANRTPGAQIIELLIHAVMTNRAGLIHLCEAASPGASCACPSSSKPRCTEDRAVVSLKNSASDSEGDTRCTARVRPLDTPDRPPVVVQTAAQQPGTGRHEVWQAAAPHCGHTHAAVAQLHAGIQAAQAADQAAVLAVI